MTAKELAYKNTNGVTSENDPQLFRLRRGNLPVLRRGVAVASVPKFKGITLYAQVQANAPAQFRSSTTSNTIINWPGVPDSQ